MKRSLALLATLAALVGLAVAPAPAAAQPGDLQPNIVGGQPALYNAGVVSIWTDLPHRNRCGGSLVAPDKIITAAHCYYALTAPDAGHVDVRIGSLDNTKKCASEDPPPPGVDCYISRTIVDYDAHPGFDGQNTRDDLMIAVLDADVPSWVRVMKWRTAPLPVGTPFRIQGWGWVCDGPPNTDCSTNYRGALQEMSAKVVDFAANCPLGDDAATQTCFKHASGGFVMACSGDSGTGGYTKGFDTSSILRVVVVGDGDDSTGRSCTTAPDGSPGAGYGIDIGRYQPWLERTLFEDAA